jgi:hypothetical protein
MLRTCRVRRSRAGANAVSDGARYAEAPGTQAAARLSSPFCRLVGASVAFNGDSKRRPATNLGFLSPKTRRATECLSRQNSQRQRAVQASQKPTPPESAKKSYWPTWPPRPTRPTRQNQPSLIIAGALARICPREESTPQMERNDASPRLMEPQASF